MAAGTLTTNMTPAQKTKYMGKFLDHFKELMVSEQFGQVVNVEHGAGKTVDFFRYHPLAKLTSACTEGSKTLTYKSLQAMNITATLTEWFDQVDFSMLHWATSRDRHLTAGVETVAQQAAESCDWHVIKNLCEHGIWPIPANAVSSLGVMDADYYAEDVVCDSVVTATNTTVVHLDESTFDANKLSDNSESLIGGWACISKGRGYGHCSRITSFESAENAMTLTNAAPEAMESAGDTTPTTFTLMGPFHASTALSNAAASKLTTECLNKAAEVLRKNRAKKFANGRYACLMTPEVHRQLLSDKRWRETAIHSPQAADGGYQNGLVATWADMDFFLHTSAPRFANTAGAINSCNETTGPLYMTLVMGQDAFGVVGLEGTGKPRLSFKIPQPDDGNTSNPNNTFGTIGWYRAWVVKPLNANFCVGILSYV